MTRPGLLSVLLLACLAIPAAAADDDVVFRLKARRRAETADKKSYRVAIDKLDWKAGQTAVVVCDMWALHHCLNAPRRGAEMAPRMNEILKLVRRQGVSREIWGAVYLRRPARAGALPGGGVL